MLSKLVRNTCKSVFPAASAMPKVPQTRQLQETLQTEKINNVVQEIRDPFMFVELPRMSQPPSSVDKDKTSKDILDDPWISQQYNTVLSKISDTQSFLLAHPIYSHLTDIDALKVLMSSHVYQVWDFMFLVKKMQHILQNDNNMPWIPPSNNQLTRFIQEIVLCEETDSFDKLKNITGKESMSHLEMYLLGMESVGLNTSFINNSINEINNHFQQSGQNNDITAINNIVRKNSELNTLVVNNSLDMFEWNLNLAMNTTDINNLHLVSAAFIFGRENIIPPMFEQVIKFIPQTKETEIFWLYLERHIEVDGGSDEHDEDSHQILGEKLIKLLCDYDEKKWNQCLQIGIESLKRRYTVWDQVLQKIQESK